MKPTVAPEEALLADDGQVGDADGEHPDEQPPLLLQPVEQGRPVHADQGEQDAGDSESTRNWVRHCSRTSLTPAAAPRIRNSSAATRTATRIAASVRGEPLRRANSGNSTARAR